MLALLRRAVGPLLKILTNIIGKALGAISPNLRAAFDDFLKNVLSSGLGSLLSNIFTDRTDDLIAKLEEIRVWLVERFGVGRGRIVSDEPFGPPLPPGMQPDEQSTPEAENSPDTRALEDSFATLQDKITGLFDDTLTDLIARVEEAVAARGCIKGA